MSKHLHATLTFEITDVSSREFQLLPAGNFSAVDGRPGSIAECKEWVCNAIIAKKIIAMIGSTKNPRVCDYEHQTLNAEKNGQPAPASGWFKNLEWREGQGLFAVNVEWTAAAQAFIKAKEYRFISPVFTFNPKTGEVINILMAALTNNPGLDNMQPVQLTAALAKLNHQEKPMNKLLAALLAKLGLAADATEEAALTALAAYAAKAEGDAAKVVALSAEIGVKTTEIATLTAKAGTPDPAQFVPVAALSQLQLQYAELSAKIKGSEVDQVIAAAKAAGKLPPALEDWARKLGNADIASLNSYLATAPVITALVQQQTGGNAPPPASTADDAITVQLCAEMGLDHATLFAKGDKK